MVVVQLLLLLLLLLLLGSIVEGAGRGSHDSQGTQASVVTTLGTGLQAPGLGHVEGSTERRHLTPEI